MIGAKQNLYRDYHGIANITMLIELLLGVLLFVLGFLGLRDRKKTNNLPPGPRGWPIVGTAPGRNESISTFCENLQKQYGDIFSVQIGSRLVICLMKHRIIKEALANPLLQDRSDFYTTGFFNKFTRSGIAFSSGKTWQNERRFAMRHLRELGMGKSSMEAAIQEEAQAIVNDLERKLGDPMEVAINLNVAVLNVTWKLVAGERYDLTNKDIMELTQKVKENFLLITGPMQMLDWFPWLTSLPQPVQDYFFQTDIGRANADSLLTFMKRVIKDHQESLDPNNIRDYIDHYLVEMEARKNDPDSTFKPDLVDLATTILDLYGAGSETTASTLRWLILYMAAYPEVQTKVQQELDENVPADRLVELRDKLPYLDAVLAELHRHVSVTPFGIPHAASEDTTVAGYTIPKGSVVFVYLRGCHYDPAFWDNPEDFRPERFLDAEGNFMTREGYVPFSTGRRACLGESLARMELFLIGSAVLKSFTISAPKGEVLTTTHDNPQHKEGVVNFAKPYKVVLRKR